MPELGPIRLQCQILFTEDHGQARLVFTAEPGSEDQSKLQMLAVIGTKHLEDLPVDLTGRLRPPVGRPAF